jgi:hypothetical protein
MGNFVFGLILKLNTEMSTPEMTRRREEIQL